jgi:tetratricopeptide (TPR) repeat protein
LILEKVPLFVLAAAIGVITVVARKQTGMAVPLSELPLSARLANAGTAYGWYLWSTFWPWHLGMLYPLPDQSWSPLAILAGTGTLLAVTGLCCWQASQRPWLLTGWLWFVGTLVPVIGLTQGGGQAWADRFSYWPHIGLFVATVWGLAELADYLRLPVLVSGLGGALILGCLSVLTWIQVGYWRDTITLGEHTLAVTKDNHRIHGVLGLYCLDKGELDEAEAHFAEAVRIRPGFPNYQYFMGVTLLSLGKDKESARHLCETLGRDPNHSDAWYNLGVARLRQGKPEVAVRCFRKVLKLQPESGDALAGMGLALWGAGKRQDALRTFQAALRQNPKDADAWRGLGMVFLAQGQRHKAIAAFRKALHYKPQFVQAFSDLGLALGRHGQWAQAVQYLLTAVQLQEEGDKRLEEMNGKAPTQDSIPLVVIFYCRLGYAFHQLGDRQSAYRAYQTAFRRDAQWPVKFTAKSWRLATNPDVNLREPRLAYELSCQAVQAVVDPPASMLDALAAAHAALGDFPNAVQAAQQALTKASDHGEVHLAKSIRKRLQCYRQGKLARR